MASGYWALRPNFTQISGAFWELLASPPRVGAGITLGLGGSGSVTQRVGDLWIYDDVLLTYTKTNITDLPSGFQILFVAMVSVGAPIPDFPNMVTSSGGNLTDDVQVNSWTTNLADWNSGSHPPPNITDILGTRYVTYNVSWNGNPGVPVITHNISDEAPAYPGFPLPPTDPDPNIAFGTFWLYGAWDDLGTVAPTPGAPSNITATPTGNPNEYSVNLTPGSDTTLLQIEDPTGTVVTVVPVSNLPVVVTLPGPNPTVTPINTNPTVTPGTPVPIPLTPSITMTMAGGIEFGGSATMVFIGDPSGIYTLTPGAIRDTLLERIPTTGTQGIKIPNPKLRTGYVGK